MMPLCFLDLVSKNNRALTIPLKYSPGTDVLNIMYVDDIAVQMNRLRQPVITDRYVDNYDDVRKVQYLKTGTKRTRWSDWSTKYKLHTSYGAIIQAVMSEGGADRDDMLDILQPLALQVSMPA